MGAQLGQAFRIQAEIMARAAPFFFDQTGRFQHLQMLRHRGTAYGNLCGEFAYSRRFAPEQVENRLARRIRKRPQHFPSVSHTLR